MLLISSVRILHFFWFKERGTIFALLSVCDNAVPLFSGVLYTSLYKATINTNPASIFWLTFTTQLFVVLLIM